MEHCFSSGKLARVAEVLDAPSNSQAFADWKRVNKLVWHPLGLNKTVDATLKQHGVHPIDVMAVQGNGRFPDQLKSGMDPVFNDLAEALFGPEIFTEQTAHSTNLSNKARDVMATIITLTWRRHRQNVTRRKNEFSTKKNIANESWNGRFLFSIQVRTPVTEFLTELMLHKDTNFRHVNPRQLLAVLRKLDEYRLSAHLFLHSEHMRENEDRMAILESMLNELGVGSARNLRREWYFSLCHTVRPKICLHLCLLLQLHLLLFVRC